MVTARRLLKPALTTSLLKPEENPNLKPSKLYTCHANGRFTSESEISDARKQTKVIQLTHRIQSLKEVSVSVLPAPT
jgi:hypothetical protein